MRDSSGIGRGDRAIRTLEPLERRTCLSVQYSITDLGTLGGTASAAVSINDSGDVVGHSETLNGASFPFLYRNGHMQQLGLAGGGVGGDAVGINARGDVVGMVGGVPFLYSGGVTRPLDDWLGDGAVPTAINQLGQITYHRSDLSNPSSHAYLYDGERSIPLSLGGAFSVPQGLNDLGQAVGHAAAPTRVHAFLYSDGLTHDLGTLGGSSSSAYGINNAGQIVGRSSGVDPRTDHAFLWSGGLMRDLGTLGTGTLSTAVGINEAGVVVGHSTNDPFSSTRAFVYRHGKMRDLNALISPTSGWLLWRADDVNNHGQIVGVGTIGDENHAFLLTPQPADLTASLVATTVPHHVLKGDRFQLSVQLRNDGEFAADGSVTVRYYLSSFPQLDVDAVLIKTDEPDRTVDLTPGESSSFSTELTIPYDARLQSSAGLYLLAEIDACDTILESDTENNVAASHSMHLYPKVVNIITHGFDPFALTGGHSAGFLQPFQVLADRLGSLTDAGGVLVKDSVLEANVQSYVANWDSSTGWIQAIPALVAVTLFAGGLDPAAEYVLNAVMNEGLGRAAALAEQAAGAIWSEVHGTLLAPQARTMSSDPNPQIIHLIGHSRGAAVNAGVADYLTRAYYDVNQYTALDGYSTDWSPPSDRLGDISITGTVPRSVSRRVNARVEDGLVAIVANYLPGLGEDIARKLSEVFVDWRAPDRPGFENPVVRGLDAPSNHVSVTRDYAMGSSGINLLASYIGDHRFDRPPVPASATRSLSLFPEWAEVPEPENTGDATSPTNISPGDGTDFWDGAFDQLGALAARAAAADFPTTDDPFFAQWFSQLRDPAFLLGLSWGSSGQVRPVMAGEDTVIELRNAGPAGATLAQEVRPTGGTELVSFDLSGVSATPGDKLQVLFGGVVLREFDLATMPTAGRYSAELAGVGTSPALLTFRLVGPALSNAVVRLDNLTITGVPLTVSDVRVGHAPPAAVASVTFSANVRASLAASDVAVVDLSTGARHDPTQFTYDAATNTATFTLATGPLPDGNYRLTIASGAVSDGAGTPMAAYGYDFFVLAGDADRDRKVGFSDLLALAKNYGKAGAWAQGDFTGDGKVDFPDLLTLAKNYNKTLPAAGAATPASAVDAGALAAAMGIAVPTSPTPAKAPSVTIAHPAPVPKSLAPVPNVVNATAASVLGDDEKARPVFSTTRVATPAPAPAKPKVAARLKGH